MNDEERRERSELQRDRDTLADRVKFVETALDVCKVQFAQIINGADPVATAQSALGIIMEAK